MTTRAFDLARLPALDAPLAGEALAVDTVVPFKTAWAAFAPTADPTFTGNPKAPTPPPGDNDTSIATTAFVQAAIVGGTAGVGSFNTRTGAVVLLNADVVAVLPSSNSNPQMDGAAAPGAATAWSRADHVHPVDTSRYAASNPSGYQTAAQVTAVVPVASGAAPNMDGAANAGALTTWSRGDHVHPTDTSLLSKGGGTMTGPIVLSADPAAAMQPVTRQYLEAYVIDAGTY